MVVSEERMKKMAGTRGERRGRIPSFIADFCSSSPPRPLTKLERIIVGLFAVWG